MSKSEKRIFKEKFEERLSQELDKEILQKLKSGESIIDEDLKTTDYDTFRKENLPKAYNFYEKICNLSEKALKIAPDKKTYKKIEKELKEAHIQTTPTGVQSASILIPTILLFIGTPIAIIPNISIIGYGIIIIGIISYFFLQNVPKIINNQEKAKANDQIIVAIFYIVSFMRFQSNLELATAFASKYLGPPLSLDFKKILWDLENQKYPNIKVAFDEYLNKWRNDNLEFLESMYLIESSLSEAEETRRIGMLDKALDLILQGNYEKMLHFSQDLKGKVNTFNMLGVVLPVLGLIILPLAASFGDPRSVWEFTLVLYIIIIPFVVTIKGLTISTGKPGGVNSIKTSNIKNYEKLTKIPLKIKKKKVIYLSPLLYSIFAFLILFLIGISPLILHFFFNDIENNINQNSMLLPLTRNGKIDVFGYNNIEIKEGNTVIGEYNFGPYGLYPGILSLFIPLAFGLGIGYYFFYKYRNLIHLRDKTKQLEKEFPSATFQLGNRIGEGISIEFSFGIVAENLKGTESGKFFEKIDKNIKFSGMSVEKAIFDEEKGAINDYPSDLIISSMKIMIKAIDKGPEIASRTLVDLSKYLTELHMAHERLIDLLAESLSSMKSQKNFLAPVISGIVVAIVSLITSIMGNLNKQISNLDSGYAASGMTGGFENAGSLLGYGIPTYLFQIPVGLYMISLIIILTIVILDLEEGEDKILKKYSIGLGLKSGMIKYLIVTGLGILLFGIISINFNPI